MSQQTAALLRAIGGDPAGREALTDNFSARVVFGGMSRGDAERAFRRGSSRPELFCVPGASLDAVQWPQVVEVLCRMWYVGRDRSAALVGAAAWGALVEEVERGSLALHPQWERAILHTVPIPALPLERVLLAQGGTRVVYQGEPHQAELLARGEAFEGPAAFAHGRPGRCHRNAARLWNAHRAELSIATGYALGADGLWRQHSWLVRTLPRPRQRRLVDTTYRQAPRYYGVRLSHGEAEAFLRANG